MSRARLSHSLVQHIPAIRYFHLSQPFLPAEAHMPLTNANHMLPTKLLRTMYLNVLSSPTSLFPLSSQEEWVFASVDNETFSPLHAGRYTVQQQQQQQQQQQDNYSDHSNPLLLPTPQSHTSSNPRMVGDPIHPSLPAASQLRSGHGVAGLLRQEEEKTTATSRHSPFHTSEASWE